MTLLTPALPQPPAIPPTTSGDLRQVLAAVDLDTPVEPAVRRAVAESFAHAAPLQVLAAVTEAAQDHGSIPFEVRLVPLSRTPRRSRSGRTRRTLAAQLRRQLSSLLVAAEQLTSDPGAPEVAPRADLRNVERNRA